LAFTRVFGDFAFKTVFCRLRDPRELYPRWAAKFAGTLLQLPLAEIQQTQNLFDFVVKSNAWRGARAHVHCYQLSFERLLRDLSDDIVEIDPLHRHFYFADRDRCIDLEISRVQNRAKNNAARKSAWQRALRRSKPGSSVVQMKSRCPTKKAPAGRRHKSHPVVIVHKKKPQI
jgi:hypothetical protein